MKKPVKIVLAILGLVFLILVLVAIFAPDEEKKVQNKPPKNEFISARDLKIKLEKEGFDFGDPYELDSVTRLMCVELNKGRTTSIFFRNDTVRNVNIVCRITDDRDNLSDHFNLISSIFSSIDPDANDWAERVINRQDVKKELEIDTVINGNRFRINYYPDVMKDMFNCGVETKLYR